MNEACKTAVDEYLAQAPKLWKTGICAGDVFDSETGATGVVKYYKGARSGYICHAWCTYAEEDHIVVTASKELHSPEQRAFALFVAKETPFSHGVLNRDNDEQIINGGMVIDVSKVGVNGCLWLCKVQRYLFEDTFRVARWTELVKAGCPKFLALVICSVYSMEGKPCAPGHNSVFAYPTPTVLKKILAFEGKDHKATSPDTYTALAGAKYDYRDTAPAGWMGFGVKRTKVDDGWGGYTIKEVPCDDECAIKNIFEELEKVK